MKPGKKPILVYLTVAEARRLLQRAEWGCAAVAPDSPMWRESGGQPGADAFTRAKIHIQNAINRVVS